MGRWVFRRLRRTERTNVDVTVLPGGSVSGQAGGNRIAGSFREPNLELGRYSFRIERQGNGFLATDVTDGAHRVYFQRTGGGY